MGLLTFALWETAVEQVIETATGQVSPYVQTHIDEERPRASGAFSLPAHSSVPKT